MPVPAGGGGNIIGDPYATRAELKARLSIPDANVASDDLIDDALASASDGINRYCNRQFHAADSATARWYDPGVTGVDTDDFWDADSLIVTPYSGAVAGAVWVADTNYLLEPVNGIRDGVPGWPYERIATCYGTWPTLSWASGYRIQVTAKWGWAAVPANVKTACLLLAAEDLKLKDAPFGVAGFGDYAIRIRQNPKAAEKLAPYVRHRLMVA